MSTGRATFFALSAAPARRPTPNPRPRCYSWGVLGSLLRLNVPLWGAVFLLACGEGSPAHDAGDAGGGLTLDASVDAGLSMDAGPAEDAAVMPVEPGALQVGQFATGVVTPTELATYRIALNQGDEVRISAFTLRGDLQPSAYLSSPAEVFVEPETYEVGEQQVLLNYLIAETGEYSLLVRPHEDVGEGSILLRTECTGGRCADQPVAPPDVPLRLLAINDFHGQLEPLNNSTGGAAWLAAHAQELRAQAEHSLFVSAGDLVGGSPFLSGRFHDEPSIEAMNLMGLQVAAVGNHEFDEGPEELLRLVQGGCHPQDGCQDGTPFDGADFEVLAANVTTTAGADLLPSFVVRVFGGLPVAVIGMTLEGTRFTTVASEVEDLVFADEVSTVNALVPKFRAMGIETIILVVHEGGRQQGGANECTNFSGNIRTIAHMVDDAVDTIISGHTHATYNCVINDKAVTSAGSTGRWISTLDFLLSGASRDPIMLEALNHPVDHSLTPDPAVSALVDRYRDLVGGEQEAVIGTLLDPLTRSTDAAGQSNLGFVIADSQLFATEASARAQIAFMNLGGIRAELNAGAVTYGQAFAVQPFGNELVTMSLTGGQLKDVLDDQFNFGNFTVLQPSASLRYQIEAVSPGSSFVRVVPDSVTVLGLPLDLQAEYRVTVNAYLAEGGDGHSTFTLGTQRDAGMIDVDAFADYLSASAGPLGAPGLDRIIRN